MIQDLTTLTTFKLLVIIMILLIIIITDLAPIKNFETMKEEDDDKEDGLQVIRMVNYVNISHDDDDVKFIKKTPLHHRERLKSVSKNYLIRNQTDKKIFPQILPQKKLIEKN